MKKFIVIYYAPQSAIEEIKNVSPEEMKKGMDMWMAWAKKCGDSLVDLGTPLGNGQKVSKSGSTPSDKDVMGYSILQAENMQAAVEMLKEYPYEWAHGCEVEVYESLPLPM